MSQVLAAVLNNFFFVGCMTRAEVRIPEFSNTQSGVFVHAVSQPVAAKRPALL